ncbi:hypothetical protein [Massilia haematophila]|uniref:Uncharacterized protein n=1 Tax=Massilia haematophila TaxID=457923 RepID=A0ABV7PJX4_9BURK
MKYLIPADITANHATQDDQEPGRSGWYPWLGLALVMATAAVTYGALAFFLID